MTIAIDIDSTINDLCKKVLVFYNKKYNKSIKMEDVITYNYHDCLPKEDADAICELFLHRELWDSLEPLPGSQLGVQTLMGLGHRVFFATATHPCNFEWKIEWMKKHFPFVDTNDIIRICDKSLLRVDVLIDDKLENLTSNFCHRICMSYPYNRNKDKDFVYDIHRVTSWKNIVNIINQIERKEDKYE